MTTMGPGRLALTSRAAPPSGGPGDDSGRTDLYSLRSTAA